MGEASRRIWLFGWRVWPSRSPQRHYYLFRNAVALMRRQYVPVVWKTWAVAKLVLTAVVHGLHGDRRREQLQQMWRGARAAFKKNDRGGR
jgi:rhamnosyltransferase